MYKKSTQIAVLLYGAFLIVGGIIGYQLGKSVVSLVLGLLFGGLLILSSLLSFARKKIGPYSSLALTFVLASLFTYRYAVSGKQSTAILATVSGAMLIYLLAQSAKWKKDA